MISSRQDALLVSIIEEFIRIAEPISSKFLEKSGFFGLSSATIRAEMCGLEELGFLTHFHTSGGRVPTDEAYRYYVDNIVNAKRKIQSVKQEKAIREAIREAGSEPRAINRVVAQTLSDLSENLVIAGIEEENDFFKTGLASLFEMPEFREFDRIFRMTSFFDEFDQVFGELERAFLHHGNTERNRKVGTRTEESYPNGCGNTKSKQNPKQKNDVKIFIGRENPVPDIRDETVMFARYNLPQGHIGSLTLVGPTRMDYAKNIGLIKYATQELNKISKTV